MSKGAGRKEETDDEQNVIYFKQPIPACRVPVQRPDGRIVLDFPDEAARQAFRQRCTTIVTGNCQQGARSTCSLKAVDSCRGPGWLRWLGWKPRKPWSEIEACEEQAMQECLEASAVACEQHSKEFCELVTRPPR